MFGISKKFLQVIIIIFLIVVIGTIGLKLIGEGKTSILDILYMTATSVITVGYGDIIGFYDKPMEKLFAIISLFIGAGCAISFHDSGCLFYRRRTEGRG
ncbi:MAG: ion channel [Pseudomonadota bacterium]|nr:ion channel [Pseudomonadota bacterium]